MIELTHEQRQDLAGNEPIVVNPQTHEEFVLVPKDLYHKLKALQEGDDLRLMYPMLADLDPEDWEDVANYDVKP